jgi:uncharacterized membrane protein/ligand-binding sensor domain-containing protein
MNTYGLPLLTLASLLIASLLLIGRGQGVRCLVMLGVFPALLCAAGGLVIHGRTPLLPTMLAAGGLAVAGQVFLLLGTNRAGRMALLGAAGGYFIAVALAAWCVRWLQISGVYTPLLRDLWYAPGGAALDFRHLALGAIALAGAGIIADLAVAVTATIQEVHKADPALPAPRLFTAGLRFGRDVIGTEINTLPFALLGTALGALLLVLVRPDVASWPYTWLELVNRQDMAVEVAAMAAGTIGLTLTIPLTAWLVARHLGCRPCVPASTPPAAPVRSLRSFSPLLALVATALAAVATIQWLGESSYRYPAVRHDTHTQLLRAEVQTSCMTGASSGTPASARRTAEGMQLLAMQTGDGRALQVENAITGSPVNDRIVAAGDRALVRLQESSGEAYAALVEIERDRGLVLLLLAVCVTVVVVSGWSGWRALVALLASFLVLLGFLFLIVRTRIPTIPAALAAALAVTALTYVILFGPGRKAAAATLGVVLGLAVASLAGVWFGQWLGFSGRHDSELMALNFYSSAHGFDFPALLGAAVIIGALGVTMDVAIGVASAVHEVYLANPLSRFPTLLAAGLAVGRKVIVAMFGAIFFAYIGLNLGLFLLPWTMPGALHQLLANERVATEAYRLLIGGLAIAWCVPATAFCAAWLTPRTAPAGGQPPADGPGRRDTRHALRPAALLVLLLAGCVVPAAAAESRPARAGDGNANVKELDDWVSGTFTYQLVIGRFYEWNTDPTAIPGLLGELSSRTPLKAGVEFKSVGLDDPQLLRNPLLIMTGNRVFKLSTEELANLRNYLQQGGFLYADDCGGSDWSFRRMISTLFPDDELQPLPAKHPLFRAFYPLEAVPKVVDLYSGPPQVLGLVHDGRLVVVYTYNTDLPCAWERYPDGSYVHVVEEEKREGAIRFGINVMHHALRQQLGRGAAGAGVRPPATQLPAPATLPAGALERYPLRRQLPCTHITAIARDQHQVWFGGHSYLPGEEEGLARWDKETGQWQLFMDAEGILSEEVNCLALRSGELFAGSDTWKWTKGLARFEPATRRWRTLTTAEGLPHNRVVALLPDEERLWVGCRQGVAVVEPGPPERINTVRSPVFPAEGAFVIGLMKNDPFVWVNHFAGLARFDTRNQEWTTLARHTPLLPRHALAMAQADQTAWFLSALTDRVALVRCDLAANDYREWPVDGAVDLNKAVALATDGSELLLGMRDNLGIYALSAEDGKLRHHWAPPDVPRDRNLRTGLLAYDDETVWASFWPNGGLWRRAAGGRDWQEIPFRAGAPASHILSLARLGNSLYAGTMGVGLWRYDLKTQRWVNLNLGILVQGSLYSYLGNHDAIRWENIYAMEPDGARLWMATNHGLILHDPERTPSGFEVLERSGGLLKGVARAEGLIWTGGDDGVLRAFDPAAQAWRESCTWASGAPVRALCVWSNSLWAATAQGLWRRSAGPAGTWAQATNRLSDLHGLWPTAEGLWISSRTALYVQRAPEAPAVEVLPGLDGLPAHAVCATPEGTLVATEQGLVVCTSNFTARAWYNRESGLGAAAISALAADDRQIWLGTLGDGLTRLTRAALAAPCRE